MSTDQTGDETVARPLEPGDDLVDLAYKAKETGDWKPVVEWLARYPEHAATFAEFFTADRELENMFPRPRPAAVGVNLHHFILKEVIGHGGMGVVHRAFDNSLNRDVAVKLLRTGNAYSSEETARFRYEAQILASLQHPNIVPVLSFGETNGEPYLVMPLMKGGSLAAWLKDLGPDRCLPPKRAAEIVRDVALGVHHAHQRGLIHRDLKPGNILLDGKGHPHVADFGLARHQDVAESISGRIAGTLSYMAPEQVRGERVLTTAVDIHALGTILFELLIGRTPYVGDNAAVMKSILEDPAPSVRALRPELTTDLVSICLKCLNKEPRDRYASAEALAGDLTKFMDDEPIEVQKRGVLEEAGRAINRKKIMPGAISWRVAFWGAASTAFAMAVMQSAVLLDAPLWVLQAAAAYYLLAYLGIIWYYLLLYRDARNIVEKSSTVFHYGIKFSCLALLVIAMSLHGGNPVYALPSFLVAIGFGIYAHGLIYWGRFYLVGFGFFVAAISLLLVPAKYWPGLYGFYLCLFQLVSGFHLLRVHKAAEAAAKQLSASSTLNS